MENNRSSSRRVIEFTVLSGEDLRIDRRSIKKNAFTIVYTDANNNNKDGYRTTNVDESGGSYPTWNEKFVLELPIHSSFINLQVQCKPSSSSSSSSSSSVNKTVGSAKIPVSDFIGGCVPENYLNFLSYRLKDAKGNKNGIINVSVRVKHPPQHAGAPTGNNNNSSAKPPRPTLLGYAPPCSSQGYASSYSSLPVGGVVTGVPVWCANRA